jgi:hypothetical protein
MPELLGARARIAYLILVLLHLAAVGSSCVCETADLTAIMYILCPKNTSTESTFTNRERNFIDAPIRCPSGERRDLHGKCKKIF